ncbi:hypothetical protein HOK68_00975 [Candidatus Woesearchaeota archaeon]|nr:hypothetical protein [Candidatus Woesearchaeota archaeon]MBT4595939.1 hypothetical protein [Candidatus Woesearchaeota archaeon]MBT5741069.1 hypothetical protein [Candidatus Woesearchaeota archaeon]MBT6505333.1 hypothetical protein [Candidatus Woesearchaeota archaeon]MBT7297016.1 hypothetical protein [Candidatus Woesearchaeota archaeon]
MFDEKHLGLGNRLNFLEKNIRQSFKNLRLELEDHLDSINDNTNEVEYISELLCDFDNRLLKLEDSIEFIKNNLGSTKPINKNITPLLNERETDIFLSIFRDENNTKPLSLISQEISIPENTIKKLISNIVKKGIPILQTNTAEGKFFYIDNDFKEKQLKQNVLNISTNLTLDIFDQKI